MTQMTPVPNIPTGERSQISWRDAGSRAITRRDGMLIASFQRAGFDLETYDNRMRFHWREPVFSALLLRGSLISHILSVYF